MQYDPEEFDDMVERDEHERLRLGEFMLAVACSGEAWLTLGLFLAMLGFIFPLAWLISGVLVLWGSFSLWREYRLERQAAAHETPVPRHR